MLTLLDVWWYVLIKTLCVYFIPCFEYNKFSLTISFDKSYISSFGLCEDLLYLCSHLVAKQLFSDFLYPCTSFLLYQVGHCRICSISLFYPL